MSSLDLYERACETAAAVRAAVPAIPGTAVVLGSGLGTLAARVVDPVVLPYGTLPHFPLTRVMGHRGDLLIGKLGGVPTAVFSGRVHYYEGHDFGAVTFAVRVMQRLGIRRLILTAATGGVDPALAPGTIVALRDHLNLLGSNPLRGPNDDRLGPRFPDLTDVYAPAARKIAAEAARELGFDLPEGVYACLSGPCYETPAEVRMLRILGADVVGMSTVPEAITARHGGMEVAAFAVVTNAGAGLSGAPLSHAEVIETGRAAAERLADLIERVVARWTDPTS